ncbi:MAG: hypothetical protein GX130_07155 [Candidatus Hydrogenedens sp.]|nr:hypothetical protein [Candidatus Hydrogenedens sp.]
MTNKVIATVVFCAFLILTAGSAGAALNGTAIEINGGKTEVRNQPVELALDTDEAPAFITVVNEESGKKYPASLRDGKLCFIIDELPAGATAKARIETGERKAETPFRVQLRKKSGEDEIEVYIDDSHFTTYHYGSQWKKPFLWPVNGEGGVGITRDFPALVDTTPRKDRDHPHQKSLWSAYGEVNGVDLWGEGTGSGTQKTVEVTFGSGDAYGWIRARNLWEDQEGTPLLDESREYRFYAVPEAGRILDVKVAFNANYGDVLLSDTKEGGIVSLRMRPDICHGNALITNALGDVGEKTAWGKPSPWCDFSGNVPDVGWRGATIFDHPENLRYPGCWHVRNYGLMGANSFGYSYFVEKEYNQGLIPENGDYTIQDKEELVFQYRVYVHTGNAEEAAVADRFENWIQAEAGEAAVLAAQ